MAVLTNDIRADLLAILLILLAVAAAYFQWAFGYWKRKGVDAPPATLPLGNAKNIMLQKVSLGEELAAVYKQFKAKNLRYCGFYFLSKPILIVLEPELIKAMMTKDFQHFTDHTNYLNEENDPLSGHLFSLKGSKWKNLRAKLTPTFTSGKMKMMFPTMLNCSDELIVIMDKVAVDNAPVDIKDLVARFTIDIIGSCAFGLDCNSLRNPNSEFREYGKKVVEIGLIQGIKVFCSIFYPGLLNLFKISLTRADVTKFFMKVVKETVHYREKNNVVREDFMHLLIQLKNNITVAKEGLGNTNDNNSAGTSLSISELAAQVFVFFFAGYETSSITLTFCFFELVSNLAIQEKLRQEITEGLDKYGGKITYDALMDMTYMDKCINETLRKYPPVPIISRECTKPYKIPDSDLVLEQGTAVFVPILGIQRDPENYPDPDKFDPERFSSENKAKRHAFTWLPFGEGPRACIGLRFGIMQIKVALAILLKNYSFSLNSKTTVPLVLDPKRLGMNVKGGIWLNAKKVIK